MLSPGLGLEAQKTGLGLMITSLGVITVVASALVVFEVLLKCFVTLTLKIWHFLFNV